MARKATTMSMPAVIASRVMVSESERRAMTTAPQAKRTVRASERWRARISSAWVAPVNSESAVVRAAAAITQPDPHQVTLALRLGPVAEARPLVRDLPVVDELHLARLEMEVHAELRPIHGAVQLVQRLLALRVERHPGQGLAIADLEARQPTVQPVRLDLEDRVMRDHAVAGSVLALPVGGDGLIQASEKLGPPVQDLVVRRGKADEATHAAFHGRMQAQQPDVLGRAQVVA